MSNLYTRKCFILFCVLLLAPEKWPLWLSGWLSVLKQLLHNRGVYLDKTHPKQQCLYGLRKKGYGLSWSQWTCKPGTEKPRPYWVRFPQVKWEHFQSTEQTSVSIVGSLLSVVCLTYLLHCHKMGSMLFLPLIVIGPWVHRRPFWNV